MEDKSSIYTYQRVNGRKTVRKHQNQGFAQRETLKVAKSTFDSIVSIFSVEVILLMLLAFFAGRAYLSGGLVPFPAAILGSVVNVIPGAGLWVLLATTIGLSSVLHGYNLGASIVVLLVLLGVLLQAQGGFKQKWYGVPLFVFGVTVIVKIAVYAYYEPNLYNFMLAFFEGVLAGTGNFLINRAMPIFRKKYKLHNLKKEELVGGAVFIIAILTGLSGITIKGLELKNIVARFLVVMAAYCGGSGFGAAMGTLTGIIPGIGTAMIPGYVALYSFSGLIAGMFRNFGRVGVTIGFVLGNLILSIYLTEYSKMLTTLIETGLALGLFMLISQKQLFAVRTVIKNSFYSLQNKNANEQRIRELTAGKVREFSRVFKELARSFEEVSCDLKTREESNLQNLFGGITTKVCKGCSLYRICWEKEFYKTYRTTMDMLAYIDVNGRLTEDHISKDLKKRCARLKEFAITINCLFENYKTNQIWQRKLVEGRDIVGNQLQGLSTIMQNLADEIKIDVRMREDIEAILRSELTRSGYSILDLFVIGEGAGQMEITISCPACGGNKQCVREIAPLISRILSQPLSVLNSNYCTQKTGDPVCEFKLIPVRNLKVEMGMASAAKHPSKISGDSYSVFDLKEGKYAIALSDGMGIGPKAEAESRAAVTLLEKLLETGFDQNSAVKTVNSILVLGSPDETFATVDLAVLDLFRGSAEFVKIGSAPSFIKRGGNVSMVRADSLPIGILHNIEIDVFQQNIGHNDVLVMVSDGVLEAAPGDETGETWIIDVLQEVITTDPQNIADLILKRALVNSGAVQDDMTVLVARIANATQHQRH